MRRIGLLVLSLSVCLNLFLTSTALAGSSDKKLFGYFDHVVLGSCDELPQSEWSRFYDIAKKDALKSARSYCRGSFKYDDREWNSEAECFEVQFGFEKIEIVMSNTFKCDR